MASGGRSAAGKGLAGLGFVAFGWVVIKAQVLGVTAAQAPTQVYVPAAVAIVLLLTGGWLMKGQPSTAGQDQRELRLPSVGFLWLYAGASFLVLPAVKVLVDGATALMKIRGTTIRPARYLAPMFVSALLAGGTIVGASLLGHTSTDASARSVAHGQPAAGAVGAGSAASATPSDTRSASVLDADGLAAILSASHAITVTASYDYRHLQDDLAAAKSVSTAQWGAQVEDTFTKAIMPVAAKVQPVVTMNVLHAGLISRDGDTATVLVSGQQHVDNTTTADRISPVTLEVTMKRIGGTWLVDTETANPSTPVDAGASGQLAQVLTVAHRVATLASTLSGSNCTTNTSQELAEATGEFKSQVEQTRCDAIAAMLQDATEVSSAAGVESADDTQATVVVANDVKQTTKDGSIDKVSTLVLHLVRVDGSWIVDSFKLG